MTLVGNRPEWVYAMVAAWRLGAVAQPCTEQLRARDLRARMDAVEPRVVVADERDADAGGRGRLRRSAADRAGRAPVRRRAGARGRPGPRTTRRWWCSPRAPSGEPKPIRHGQGYLAGQAVQAEHWFGARPGRPLLVHGGQRLVEVRPQRLRRPVAARRRGAAPRRPLRPRRAAGAARARARGRALHGAHRVPGDRQARRACAALPDLRHAVAAGEPLNPEVVHAWREALGRGRARRLRPDRDRRAHRHADRPAGAARVDGHAAARLPALDR